MTARGLLAESQTLLARREQAGPGVARALIITDGRRRSSTGSGCAAPTASPMCIEDAYLNEVLIPGFLQAGMPTSLYDALGQRGLRPTGPRTPSPPTWPPPRRPSCSRSRVGSPVLRQSRRALSRGKVVEVSRSVYRADRFTRRVQLGRES